MTKQSIIVSTMIVAQLFVSGLHAEQIEISSSLNPVGSGARATGMGGAFISVADDATAASWNPAGLVQLEKPEVSIVYSYFHRTQDMSSPVHPEIDGENRMDSNGVNYASAAYPFVFLKRNMIVSLNYQRLYEMDKRASFKYDWNIKGNTLHDNIGFRQEGYLYALSPAYAVQVTPEFHLGATLNFWGDFLGENGWSSAYNSSSNGVISGHQVVKNMNIADDFSFRGFNANIGLLWNVYGPFTIGAVYKTPFDARLRKETEFHSRDEQPLFKETYRKTVEGLTMKMPASYGLGLSYKHSDKWMIAFDVYRTGWSRFAIRDSSGKEKNPIDGRPLSKGRPADTTQVRLGTEYLFIGEKNVIPVRAGLFYDPEPQRGGLDDFYGFSLGSGYSVSRFSVDASYQYRFGRGVSGDVPAVQGSKADIDQHTVMLSLIYYF